MDGRGTKPGGGDGPSLSHAIVDQEKRDTISKYGYKDHHDAANATHDRMDPLIARFFLLTRVGRIFAHGFTSLIGYRLGDTGSRAVDGFDDFVVACAPA